MHEKTRKILPLVGALALTSSALLAGTGAAFAGKAPPTAQANSPHCDTILGNGDYDVNVDFMANKGKWVQVSVDIETLAGRNIKTNHSKATRHDMNKFLVVEATDPGTPAEPANAVVKIWNRKGALLDAQEFAVCS